MWGLKPVSSLQTKLSCVGDVLGITQSGKRFCHPLPCNHRGLYSGALIQILEPSRQPTSTRSHPDSPQPRFSSEGDTNSLSGPKTPQKHLPEFVITSHMGFSPSSSSPPKVCTQPQSDQLTVTRTLHTETCLGEGRVNRRFI